MTSLVLFLLAAPGSAPPASAAAPALPSRVFILVVPQAGAPPSATFEPALRKALTGADVEVADPGVVFPAAEVKDEGAKKVTEAREAYDNLDVDAAGLKSQEALTWYTAHPEASDGRKLAEVHLLLAAVALQNGGKQGPKKAGEDMARALVFNPEAQLDPKFFAPDTKKLFDKAKAEVAARPRANLSLVSNPPAQATFRDKVAGGSVQVPMGRHHVAFSLGGYRPGGVLVDVPRGGADAKLDLKPVAEFEEVLRKAASLVPASFAGKRLPQDAKSLASAVNSRFLVMVSAGAAGGSLEVWDPQTGNRLGDVPFEGEGSLTAAAAQVKTFVSRPSPVEQAKPVAVVEHGGGPALYKQWWLWAAVGGVVVVGAASAGIAVAASGPHVTPYNPVLNF